ncbi:MAG: hypothetical protein V1881_01055 [Candidatus Micrarchaeota archaeon]
MAKGAAVAVKPAFEELISLHTDALRDEAQATSKLRDPKFQRFPYPKLRPAIKQALLIRLKAIEGMRDALGTYSPAEIRGNSSAVQNAASELKSLLSRMMYENYGPEEQADAHQVQRKARDLSSTLQVYLYAPPKPIDHSR